VRAGATVAGVADSGGDERAEPSAVDHVRAQFPALADGLAFFDGPGGSQTPVCVAQRISEVMLAGLSNRDRGTPTGRRADDIVLQAREAMADLLNAEAEGVVFGRSMTALTYDLARTLARHWTPGDEVVLTSLDHDANVRPWMQAAHSAGAVVRRADFDTDTSELPVRAVTDQLSERTRVVAFTAASNVLGTRPDVAEVVAAAHRVGALAVVDAVHLAPHGPVDLTGWDADVVLCSPYKFCGPHLGVLAGRPDLLASLRPEKLLPSPDRVPERFELGTLPYELLAGTTAAVDFLAGLASTPGRSRRERLLQSYRALEEHEQQLRERLEGGLARIDGSVRYSIATHRTPTTYFALEHRRSAEVSAACARAGLIVPASHFYAIEASRRLGLGETGAMRAGMAPYTTEAEVDRLLEAVEAAG
jgi:cysteine desulfurase family protein (TIGR01976 family)